MSKNINKPERPRLFHGINYLLFLSALVIITFGYMLMIGDSTTETAFQPDIFSRRRICAAPAVCLVGYILVIAGIIWKQ